MTSVIVNDASALIDLKVGSLLHVLGRLPYDWVIPLPLRESEVLSFSAQDWQTLETGGFSVFDLPPELVAEAFTLRQKHPRLSANDCFCLAATRAHENVILLTGDRPLRQTAEAYQVAVHGVLWVADELVRTETCERDLIHRALLAWKADPAVRLPAAEIGLRLGQF